jgi:hypothetical protein
MFISFSPNPKKFEGLFIKFKLKIKEKNVNKSTKMQNLFEAKETEEIEATVYENH